MKRKSSFTLLLILLIQSISVIIFNISILGSTSLLALKRSIPFFSTLVLVTALSLIVTLKNIDKYMKKELELEMMKANLLNTHELLNLLHNQRHSYVGHIQAISAMAFLEEYDSLGEYVKGISKEYRLTSEILRVGNPALTALINTKKEIAQERGIAFEVECKHKIDRITIESWDLSNLLSNLLENAIEAAVESNEKPPSIKMTIAYSDQVYKFDIENTGQIKYDIVNTILEPGITSKGSIGRGYGLYICKKILDKYNGILTFNNTQNSTVVFTICLPGEDSVYDKKVS